MKDSKKYAARKKFAVDLMQIVKEQLTNVYKINFQESEIMLTKWHYNFNVSFNKYKTIHILT